MKTVESVPDWTQVRAGDDVELGWQSAGATVTVVGKARRSPRPDRVAVGNHFVDEKTFVSATREVPEWEPGQTGTATVSGEPHIRVMVVGGSECGFVSAGPVGGTLYHRQDEVLNFTPDTPASHDDQAEVEVEGSFFPVRELPRILGNHMRMSTAYAQSAMALEAERDAVTAAYERRGLEIDRLDRALNNLDRAQKIEEEGRLFEQARANAMMAEVTDLKAALGIEKSRVDDAERRVLDALAVLDDNKGREVSCAGTSLTTPGCFAYNLAERVRAALAADNEQATEAAGDYADDSGMYRNDKYPGRAG